MKNLLVVFSHGKEFGPCFLPAGLCAPRFSARHKKTTIVHGWGDSVVPVQNSVRFAAQHQCDLQLLDGDHRLDAALPKIVPLFEMFLKQIEAEK